MGSNFAEGVAIEWRNKRGIISFLDDYITLRIVSNPKDRSKNVDIVIYKQYWKEIKLIKESEK